MLGDGVAVKQFEFDIYSFEKSLFVFLNLIKAIRFELLSPLVIVGKWKMEKSTCKILVIGSCRLIYDAICWSDIEITLKIIRQLKDTCGTTHIHFETDIKMSIYLVQSKGEKSKEAKRRCQ